MFGEIANQCGAVDLAEERRRFAHRHRAGTERLDKQAVARELVGPFNDTQAMGRAKTELENAGFRPVRYKRD